MVSKQKFGPLTLYVLMDFFIDIDRIKMGLSYFGSQVTTFFQSLMFMYLKIIFTLTNSADPNEMQHFVALHLGLHCLSKYSFRSQRFNIHVQVSTVAQGGRASRTALSGIPKLNLLYCFFIRYSRFIRYTFVNSNCCEPYYFVFFLGYYQVNPNITYPYLSVMQFIARVPFRSKP